MSTLEKEMFQSNSHKSKELAEVKEESKKVEKVISGTASTKKKSWISKVKDTFVSEDASSVGDYILLDIIVPAVKDNLLDIVSRGVEMLLFGGAPQARSRGSRTGSRIYTSYDTYYRPERRREDNRGSRRRPSEYVNLDEDIFIEDEVDEEGRRISGYAKASKAMDYITELFNDYHRITVSDVYDTVGISTPWTMESYGWESLSGFYVRRVHGGALIILPKAIQLN